MKTPLLQLFASALILGSASLAHATSAVAIYPQEGNTTCNNIALNTQINEISVSRPMITAPETYTQMGSGDAVAYYANTGTQVAFRQSSKPINFVLLKSSAGAKLFIYPKGVLFDTDMKVNLDGKDQTITGITLCYGMTDTLPPQPEPMTIKSCGLSTTLDATGVSCPNPMSGRSLVCNFELDKSFYGLTDGSDSCCVCNSDALVECDPDAPQGESGSCIDPMSKLLPTEVTTHIELNNDPYYCSTVSGIRTCYKY